MEQAAHGQARQLSPTLASTEATWARCLTRDGTAGKNAGLKVAALGHQPSGEVRHDNFTEPTHHSAQTAGLRRDGPCRSIAHWSSKLIHRRSFRVEQTNQEKADRCVAVTPLSY